MPSNIVFDAAVASQPPVKALSPPLPLTIPSLLKLPRPTSSAGPISPATTYAPSIALVTCLDPFHLKLENLAIDSYSAAMAQGQKPSNLWEFRKQDDPDSSDEDFQSSSSAEARLKQISDSVAAKNRQATDINHQFLFMNKPVKKDNRMQFLNHAMKVDRKYGRKMKRQIKESKVKSYNREPESATISSNLILMQSILEELRVKREHLLEWMRTEVRRLIDDANTKVPKERVSKWKIKLKYIHDQLRS